MIKYLVLSGGGIKAISFLGTLCNLYKTGYISDIQEYSGCSAGAIISYLLNIGYTPEELINILLSNEFDLDSLSDMNFLEAFKTFGIESGKLLVEYLNKLTNNKLNCIDITFQELYLLTNKKLYINTVCLTDNTHIYLSVDTHPNMKILTAINMSFAIPILFIPVTYENKLYVDGGLLKIVPYDIFAQKNVDEVLVINFDYTNDNFDLIDSFESYIKKIFTCILKPSSDINLNCKIISINCSFTNEFLSLNYLNKKIYRKLYKLGYRTANEFIKTLNI